MEDENEELSYFDSLKEGSVDPRAEQAKAQMDRAFDEQIAGGKYLDDTANDAITGQYDGSAGAINYVSNDEMERTVENARQQAFSAGAGSLLGYAGGIDWEDRNLRSQALEAALRTNPIDPPAIVQTAEAFYAFLKGEKVDG